MEDFKNKKVSCSNCGSWINKNYCPTCGQLHVPKRLTATVFISDFADSFFSLKRSYLLNLKQLLLKPRFVVQNYWNGYRNFFFSPNRMLFITAFLISIYLYFTKNRFLGIDIELSDDLSWLGVQFLIAIFLLFFFVISTIITYFKKRKNVFEHLALNSYIFSLTIPIFLILAFFLLYFSNQNYLQIFFTVFYFLWIARVFESKWWKIFIMAAINLIVFLCLTGLFVYGINAISK